MSQPEDMIERIVAGVLAQLQRPADAAHSAPARPDLSPAQPGPAKTLEIQDDVVTGTLLEERGIISGPVIFGRKTVLTPSALDFLNTRKLAWRRADRNNAVAETRGKWLAIVTRSTPAVDLGTRPDRQRLGRRLDPRIERLPSRGGPAGGECPLPRRVPCRRHHHGQTGVSRLPGQSESECAGSSGCDGGTDQVAQGADGGQLVCHRPDGSHGLRAAQVAAGIVFRRQTDGSVRLEGVIRRCGLVK